MSTASAGAVEPTSAAEPSATAPGTSAAEPAPPEADASTSGWVGDESPASLSLVVPLWLPFMKLETTIESDSTFGENIETESEVGWVVVGSLEAGYKSLAARIDAFGIGFEDTLLRLNGEESEVVVESSGFVGRGILLYEFGPWNIKNDDPTWQVAVAPLAGARYNRVALETGEVTEIDGAYTWTDLLVGVRGELRLGDWRFVAHADVGGFGASFSSDLALWGALNAEYMIVDWFSVWAGWQHYQVHFEKTFSSGRQESMELLLTGPSAGVSFHIF